MKPLTKYTLLTAMLISFGLAGCSSSTDSTDELETVTEEDLEIAAEVVSESISDQAGGTMNSVFDAVSDVSESGISYSNTQSKSQYSNEDAGRGRESKIPSKQWILKAHDPAKCLLSVEILILPESIPFYCQAFTQAVPFSDLKEPITGKAQGAESHETSASSTAPTKWISSSLIYKSTKQSLRPMVILLKV